MNKLQRFDKKLEKVGLTAEQRTAVVEALDEYMNEYFREVEDAYQGDKGGE